MKAATIFSEHVERENYRLFVVLNFVSYVGFLAHLLFITLFLWINLNFLAIFNVFSVSAWLAAYLLNRHGRHVEAVLLVSIEVFSHAIVATYFLGWDSGFHYYFMPFVLFVFINHKQSLLMLWAQVFTVFCVYLWLLINTSGAAYQIVVDSDVIESFQFLNIAVNFLAIGLLGYGLRSSSVRAEWEMEQLAIRDSLTGLYNRRKMQEMIELEQVRLQRSAKTSVLVISDIDLFKTVNDRYGHDSGDYVLKEISALMRSVLRQQDILSRWGGEEFTMLLPETDVAGARQVIEMLREVVATHTFKHNKEQIPVTMTFGMALLDGRQSIEGVLRQADQLLYKGKEQGRNCIVTLLEVNPEY
ncbi:MAG: GGDEF domain-containing protein [Gammaproteobacteria bacterium]|nr:GGDEF domain-containing protein [Gammaproteobacteria bacterium]